MPLSFTAKNVVAMMSRRGGGVSDAPYDSFNLASHVADAPARVAANRARWQAALGLVPVRLAQVHGAGVRRVRASALNEPPLQADASVCTELGLACEVQVADCLPVLLADREGRVVGAAHAGWRGLAAGVLEHTLHAMGDAAGVAPQQIEAWLGPCIGPRCFEVGRDVVDAFAGAMDGSGHYFKSTARDGKWHGDLAGLARERLRRAGLTHIAGNDGAACWCTVENDVDWFSYRRDGRTGRMAAAVGLKAGAAAV
jgi:YfiH family protein